MSKFSLQTGDIILFDYRGKGFFGIISYLIKYLTNSHFSHIGMVLKDPDFLGLKGYYLWESNWEGTRDPQDNKIKLGVQITPFDQVYHSYKQKKSKIFLRRLQTDTPLLTIDKLKSIHDTVYCKPYDLVPTDWWEAYQRIDTNPQKLSRFWCSALVGYIYTRCGVFKRETDWSILRPADFSGTCNLFTDNCRFTKEEEI